MFSIPAGFDFGTTITSVLRVKFTGFSTRPCAKSIAGIVVFADANTSAGAPFVICVASVFEPANEYVWFLSIAGKTSVSEAAAKTLIGFVTTGAAAAVPPIAAATSRAARTRRALMR